MQLTAKTLDPLIVNNKCPDRKKPKTQKLFKFSTLFSQKRVKNSKKKKRRKKKKDLEKKREQKGRNLGEINVEKQGLFRIGDLNPILLVGIGGQVDVVDSLGDFFHFETFATQTLTPKKIL